MDVTLGVNYYITPNNFLTRKSDNNKTNTKEDYIKNGKKSADSNDHASNNKNIGNTGSPPTPNDNNANYNV